VFELRIHGRGGQGVVTAAELLSVAAFLEGRHAQAFPTFGSERTGAPVVSFCRIADTPIRLREPIAEPDALIVQDPTLLHLPEVLAGIKPGAPVLVNTTRMVEGMLAVPATDIARRHIGKPIPNAALLGGFAALSPLVSIDSVEAALRERFSGRMADGNVAAAREAYAFVLDELREPAHA
jgi:pyruvate ferredoxin oxidoreductase gamma subunit